jgi:aminoglycoside/choline kinase family phosphotransferase
MTVSSVTDPHSDPRLKAGIRFAAESQLHAGTPTLAPASADASFRRYFRATWPNGETAVLMDAPPDKEDVRPFVQVADLMAKAGLTAPKILAADVANGYLLLNDLGNAGYLKTLHTAEAKAADTLMRGAIQALVQWQQSSRPNVLPNYDEALLRRELGLFPEWCIDRHAGLALNEKEQGWLSGVMNALVQSALEQPSVFVHRDFMPRNMMRTEDPGVPAILDFQDAVYGPITYDVVSLFRDAFISWDEERELDWVIRYWEEARKVGLPVHGDFGDFWRAYEFMGLQRHLKVLGIFCRLNYRDGKSHYLEDLPRFYHYAFRTAERYAELRPLVPILERLSPRDLQIGYTF